MSTFLKKMNLQSKKVLLRVDFNVPLSPEGKILDDERLIRVLPTINYILSQGASIILMSHLGRPGKKRLEDGTIDINRYTLKHLVKPLTNLIKKEIQFASDCGSQESQSMAAKLESGDILLLENTRFVAGETKGDKNFAKSLSKLGDVFINDAFGTSHRAHASTAIIANYFDAEHKGFGFLIEDELKNAEQVLNNAKHPFVLILGGAKISDKIPLIEHFLDKADHIIIGGGMAYTFCKAQGGCIGNSLVQDDYLDLSIELLEKAKLAKVKIWLPQDSVIADKFSADANTKITSSFDILDDWMGLDIGPKAINDFTNILKSAKTILWNGPMGVFEMSAFSKGTLALAQAIADATDNGAYSLIGGGDSASAVKKAGYADKVSYISTGGGAMLTLLEGNPMPGLESIKE